jgi:hypothetical protein
VEKCEYDGIGKKQLKRGMKFYQCVIGNEREPEGYSADKLRRQETCNRDGKLGQFSTEMDASGKPNSHVGQLVNERRLGEKKRNIL